MFACLAIHARLSAQVPDHLVYVLPGTVGDRLGAAVGTCGDVDGDGCADFLVGEPRADGNGADSGRARVHSGADGRVLWTITGDAAGDQLGFSVAGAGDVDRDGRGDFILGAPFADANGTDAGRARVYSGRDGRILWTFDGTVGGAALGTSVGSAGDLDGDGHADCLLGAPRAGGGVLAGSAVVRSGRDGSVLWSFQGGTGEQLGTWVSAAGDVDRDGRPDVIVGAPYANGRAGRALVFSGRSGGVLWTLHGGAPGDEFGICVSGAGDVDRDGHADLLVGAWLDDAPALDSGSASVFSGRDGSLLRTLTGGPNDHLGWRVAGAGDVDGDGHADVAAGKGWFFTLSDSGYTRVWSGRDGSILRTFDGYQVAGGEDLTGDGIPDLVTGAWQLNGEGGTAWVYSGAALTLAATPHVLRRTNGGTQTLRLQAGVAHAGRSYWVVGSLNGTKPGVALLGLHFPINPDPYTVATLSPLGPPWFLGFQGRLDGTGRATARISVPPGLPALTFQHAFVVHDATSLHMVSNAASLRLDD